MKGKIAIEILGHKIRPVLNLDSPGKGKILLTTSDTDQKAGKIRILLLRDNEKILLKELIIRNIPPAESGEPDIFLIVEYKDRFFLNLFIEMNGKRSSFGTINLKPYRSRKIRNLFIGLFLLILLISAAYFLLKPFKSKPVSKAVEQKAEKPLMVPAEETAKKAEKSAKEAVQEPSDKGSTEKPDKTPVEKSIKTSTKMPAEESSKEPAIQPVRKINIYFYPESAELTLSVEKELIKLLPLISADTGRGVVFSGHCALYGNEANRQKLSVQRAENVASFLRQKGWSPKLTPEVHGYGGNNPVTKKMNEQHLNRRVEIRF